MIILGIDPGSLSAGYAFIEVEGRRIKYLSSGTMIYRNISEFIDRLGHIYSSCQQIVAELFPDEIVLESLIYVKSPTSLMKLAQARGAMIAAFMKTHQGKVFEYSPNLVKSTVSGHGHADKESIQKALTMLFGERSFNSNDESDALAVAVCHALNRKNYSIIRDRRNNMVKKPVRNSKKPRREKYDRTY